MPLEQSYLSRFSESACNSQVQFESADPTENINECTKSLFWPRKNPGCAILLAEKTPAGMGTPRPGLAKLRVSLERHSCCAKIAQWSGPRTAVYFERKIIVFAHKNIMFLLKAKCVFFKQKICLLQTGSVSSSHREKCLLDTEHMSCSHRMCVFSKRKCLV